jgi:hypothetical protein
LRQAVSRLSLPRKHYGPAVLISQWTGRRKSELSDLRRRSEHDAYLSFVQVKRPIHLQAKSTAQSANREKSPKLASEARRGWFSGGPGAPDSGPMRVFRAGDERIPKTEDSLADDAVHSELVSGHKAEVAFNTAR